MYYFSQLDPIEEYCDAVAIHAWGSFSVDDHIVDFRFGKMGVSLPLVCTMATLGEEGQLVIDLREMLPEGMPASTEVMVRRLDGYPIPSDIRLLLIVKKSTKKIARIYRYVKYDHTYTCNSGAAFFVGPKIMDLPADGVYVFRKRLRGANERYWRVFANSDVDEIYLHHIRFDAPSMRRLGICGYARVECSI